MFQCPARNGELTVLRLRITNRRANRQRPSETRRVASILDYSFVFLETIDSQEITVTSLNTFILTRPERFLCVTFSLLSQIWCACFKQEYKCKVKLVNLYKPIVKYIYVCNGRQRDCCSSESMGFRRQPYSTFPR